MTPLPISDYPLPVQLSQNLKVSFKLEPSTFGKQRLP